MPNLVISATEIVRHNLKSDHERKIEDQTPVPPHVQSDSGSHVIVAGDVYYTDGDNDLMVHQKPTNILSPHLQTPWHAKYKFSPESLHVHHPQSTTTFSLDNNN